MSQPQPPLPREVRILVAVAFFVALGFGIVAPALPVFAREFGVGRAAAAGVISAFAFMRIAFALPAGRLVDRLGERVVLASGIAVVATSSALAGLANSYVELIVLRGRRRHRLCDVLDQRDEPAGQDGPRQPARSGTRLLAGRVPARRHHGSGARRRGHRRVDPAAVLPVRRNPRRGGYGRDRRVAGNAVGRPQRPDRTSRTTLGDALRKPAYRAALAANFADSWGAVGVRSALIPLFVGDVLHKPVIWTGLGFLVVSAVNGAMLLPAASIRRQHRPQAGDGHRLPRQLRRDRSARDLARPHRLLRRAGAARLRLRSARRGTGAVVGDVVEGRGGPVFAAYSMSADLGTVIGRSSPAASPTSRTPRRSA